MQRLKRTALLVTSLAVIAAGVTTVAAQAANTQHDVRQSDFLAGLSDTRASGHFDFLKEGLRAYTDDSTSAAKVAEYFPVTGPIPTSGSMDWYGTTPQPGQQIVFDVDGISGNGNDFNILVGEPVYGGNWWLTNGSSPDAKAADPSGSNDGGNGSAYFGTLQEWKDALPAGARVYAGGFSLGSGVKGDGVLRSITYNSDDYVFTDEPVVTAPPVVNVTGTATGSVTARTARVDLKSDATPAGSVEGHKLVWQITVDGGTMFRDTMGAAETAMFRYGFPNHTGAHSVRVYRAGTLVRTITVRTS